MPRALTDRNAPALFVAILLGTVLLGLTAYTLVSDRNASLEAERAERLTRLSRAYSNAHIGIAEVETIALQYVAAPSPSLLERFNALVDEILAEFVAIDALGEERDRRFVAEIREQHLPALDTVRRFFSALASGRPFTEALPDPNTPTLLKAALADPALRRQAESIVALERLSASQTARTRTTAIVFALGLALIALSLFANRQFSRRELRIAVEVERLRREALTDSLTGLGNHRAFHDRLRRVTAAGGAPGALLLVDVDRLKEVNDLDGHAAGDGVIRHVADVLTRRAGAAGQAFRLGGDEFGLILSTGDAPAAARAIRATVAQEMGSVTVSIGLSIWTDPSTDSGTVFSRADAALLWAKRRGRDQVVDAAQIDGGLTAVVSTMASSALQAVLAGHSIISPAYQPIWRIDGRVTAYEALARFDPALGLDGPAEAFALAERFGRARHLDRLCHQAQIEGARALPDGTLLFLNVSPATLLEQQFSWEELISEARGAGLDPARLVVEITERVAAPAELLRNRAETLRALGLGVALDDVGVGNSGLELLRDLGVDWVKIDRSVISGATSHAATHGVLRAILTLARETGANVIAEGIETEQELRTVEQAARASRFPPHLLHAQGYLFGRPRAGFAPHPPGVLRASVGAEASNGAHAAA